MRVSLQLSRSRFKCDYRVHELIPTENQILKSSPKFSDWCPPDSSDFEMHPNEITGKQISCEKMSHSDGKEYNIWKLFTNEDGVTCTACELYHKGQYKKILTKK